MQFSAHPLFINAIYRCSLPINYSPSVDECGDEWEKGND